MKRLLTGSSQAAGPKAFGGMWKWLITGALLIGIAPASVQAQGIGYGETASGQPGSSQTGRLAAATLFGLQSENGCVRWPIGLQILQPVDETKALREQLELVLYFVATQAAEGKVNRVFIEIGLQAVHDLRQLLRPREKFMPAATYTEATRFLDRAERGLTKVKEMAPEPGNAYP